MKLSRDKEDRRTLRPCRSSTTEMGLCSAPRASASNSSKDVLDVKGNVSIASMISPVQNCLLAADGLPSTAPSAKNLPPDCLTCKPIPTLPMCSSVLRPLTHCRTIPGVAAAKSTDCGGPLWPSRRTWKMQCAAPPMPASVKVLGSVAALQAVERDHMDVRIDLTLNFRELQRGPCMPTCSAQLCCLSMR